MVKRTFILQDVLSWVSSGIPGILVHNFGKYLALKRAFYMTAIESLDGDYLEFGIYTGSSFTCALREYRKTQIYGRTKTRFFGFDSFTGFGKITEEDRHPFYTNGFFSIDERKVENFIKKKSEGEKIKIVKGYFEDTIKGKKCEDFSIKKIRIAFIDCDLKKPSKIALDFITDGLQQGTIIILDDFFSYKGNSKKGTSGAFVSWLEENPAIKVRELFTYGALGKAYIIESV